MPGFNVLVCVIRLPNYFMYDCEAAREDTSINIFITPETGHLTTGHFLLLITNQ